MTHLMTRRPDWAWFAGLLALACLGSTLILFLVHTEDQKLEMQRSVKRIVREASLDQHSEARLCAYKRT